MSIFRNLVFVFCVLPLQHASAIEFHDGHIHYNNDAWPYLPADQALEYFTESGVDRVIVSSTPAEGTERLYQLSSERIIPFIKPYRDLKDVMHWHDSQEILQYLRDKAKTGLYQGFGEFHMWIEHMEGSIMPEVMKLAKQHDWALSAHTDIEAMRALAGMQPSVPVIWAHCGFDYSAADIQKLLETYANTYCEFSLYEKLVDEDNNLMPEWIILLEKHPDRFMVGIDTYKNKRWADYPVHAELIREWLSQLSPKTAALVARGNIDRLFPVQ